MTSLHRIPVYATVLSMAKSVSQPDSAAQRSAISSACSGVAHAFSAFSLRSIRRWPLRPLPRLR
jgi:hypothetical protein